MKANVSAHFLGIEKEPQAKDKRHDAGQRKHAQLGRVADVLIRQIRAEHGVQGGRVRFDADKVVLILIINILFSSKTNLKRVPTGREAF